MASIALAIVRGLALAKSVKEKALPIVKAYACRSCNTMAFVTFENDKITIKRCVCK